MNRKYKKAFCGLIASFVFLGAGEVNSSDIEKQTIVFASNEYTANWNPLSPSSIPAEIASRLVTEQLFQKRCMASRKRSNLHFKHFCAHSSTDVSTAGSLRLVINEEVCGGNSKPLSREDISFTLNEFAAARENLNNIYRLSIDGRERIRIGFPINPPHFLAKNILRFPIIRAFDRDQKIFEPGDFAVRRMSSGDEIDINKATGGDYEITKIGSLKTTLKKRIRNLDDSKGAIQKFEFKYFDRHQDLRDLMNKRNKNPDVVLSFPSDKASTILDSVYRKRSHAAAAHVTYMGYNFNSLDRKQLSIVENTQFRRLISQSLWSIPLVRQIVGVETGRGSRGVWLGASPDANERWPSDAPLNRMLRKRIERFLNRQQLPSNVNMRVLVSPVVVKRQFDVSDRLNIGGYLNRVWAKTRSSKGITFELIDPQGMAGFEKDILNNQFHMVFDSQVFAHKMAYMIFTKPGSQTNNLGTKVFSETEIDDYLSSGAIGMQRYLAKFSEQHPISVLGYFPSRVLLSARVLPKHDCPLGMLPYTFYNLKKWAKR